MRTIKRTYLEAARDILDEGIRAGDVVEIDREDGKVRVVRTLPIDRFPRLLPHLWAFRYLDGPSLPVRAQPEPMSDPEPLRLVT